MSEYITGILRAMADLEREPLTFRQCENLHLAAETIDLLRARVSELEAERDHAVRRADVAEEESGIEHRRANDFCEGMRQAQSERDALSAQLRAAREQAPVLRKTPMPDRSTGFVFTVLDYDLYESLPNDAVFYAAPVPPSQEARDALPDGWHLAKCSRFDGNTGVSLYKGDFGLPYWINAQTQERHVAEFLSAILAAKEKGNE